MKVKHMALRFHSGLAFFAVLVLILLTGVACEGSSTGASPAPTSPSVGAKTTRRSVISAEGKVVPVKQATLSFEVSGRLAELEVSEGDTVEVGQVVARLSRADWQQRVDEAQAALGMAQAQLAQAKAGARAEEIVAAQEALAGAEAGVSAARANLSSARAELARLEAGAKPEELTAAKAAMDKAAIALQLAQSEYDKISWQSGIGATGQAVALQQASDDYESARANYEGLVRGATVEELAIGRAAVEAAEAQVEVAQAQSRQAKAQLDLLLAGPAAEAIAVAEAQVEQARIALQGARLALEKAVLVSPLSGTVGAVRVEEGEVVMAGAPVLTIGDLTTLRVETNDLSEVDIVEVVVGQEVEVSVDALPGEKFRGRVSEIAPMAEEQHGDIVYKVTVDLEEGPAPSTVEGLEAGLRWGMTAYVDILVGE